MALQATMVMPALLLQKPHPKSKAKEHSVHLNRRLKQWMNGDIIHLLDEGRVIQQRLDRQHKQRSCEHTARIFAKMMMEGEVRAALRLISEDQSGGILSLDIHVLPDNHETVRESLLKKHPPGRPPIPSAIVSGNVGAEPHPVIFDEIDEDLIRITTIKTEGSAGPSGVDAAAWQRLYTSFKSCSIDLCQALSMVAGRISTTLVDPSGLEAFVACRLITLDKCPGIRPIGIGEVARRSIGKAIARILAHEIQEITGPLQTCAGHLSGCEAAVHAMHEVSGDGDVEGIILVVLPMPLNV